MERKVFETEAAAVMLNEHFISIKVDREERPDVDHSYMNACQALTGSGGWPLSIFMTPDKLPFFAGTYFPLGGFIKLSGQINELWQNNRSKINESVSEISKHLQGMEASKSGTLTNDLINSAYRQLSASFDGKNGGFGGAPKFPSSHILTFLMRYATLHQDEDALKICDFTLEKMHLGGLFDHVGGGFFRYSTDERFLIPHFEKMLYDNAMLIIAYSEAGKHDIADMVILFCLEALKAPSGGFLTAIDADSEGVEGKYYLFTKDEILACLEEDGKRYCDIFNVTEQGNFEGKTHLNLLFHGKLSSEDESFAISCNKKLLALRAQRIAPITDDKIIMSSNALMVAALSTTGQHQNNREYVELAVETAEFIGGNMCSGGRFYGVYNGGMQNHPATSDDYAYYTWGLFRLHQATLDEKWLKRCIEITEQMYELFADSDGLLWLSGHDVKDIPFRSKNTYDGALPSGNAIAAEVYQRLYILLGDEKYHERYQAVINALADEVNRMPRAYTSLLSAIILNQHGGVKVELPEPMSEVRRNFYPFVSYRAGDSNKAQVCIRAACLPPVSDSDELNQELALLNKNKEL